MSKTIKELLTLGAKQLSDYGIENGAGDARTLLGHVLSMDRTRLFLAQSQPVSDPDAAAYEEMLRRREAGEPLQYITGEQDFMGLTFHVDPRVLIPRQDTEPMVEEALEYLAACDHREGPLRVLDICTGSGAIGLAIAKLADQVQVTCTDLSTEALAAAEANAKSLGLSDVRFLQGDLLAAVPEGETFHMILSNPPYIPSKVIGGLQVEIREHEPMLALDGGEDGLDPYRILIPQLADRLEDGGVAMLEIGDDQGPAVKALFAEQGRFCDICVKQDLAGRDRYVTARRNRP